MATRYPVKLSLTLTPMHHQRPIKIICGIDKNLTEINLTESATLYWEFEAQHITELTVALPSKKDQEAVMINDVSFFGISDPKFVWAGVYTPIYPEPWASQQRASGVELQPELTGQNCLGWPGKWTLTFDVPVFTWIHKTQNLGWIYG